MFCVVVSLFSKSNISADPDISFSPNFHSIFPRGDRKPLHLSAVTWWSYKQENLKKKKMNSSQKFLNSSLLEIFLRRKKRKTFFFLHEMNLAGVQVEKPVALGDINVFISE